MWFLGIGVQPLNSLLSGGGELTLMELLMTHPEGPWQCINCWFDICVNISLSCFNFAHSSCREPTGSCGFSVGRSLSICLHSFTLSDLECIFVNVCLQRYWLAGVFTHFRATCNIQQRAVNMRFRSSGRTHTIQ